MIPDLFTYSIESTTDAEINALAEINPKHKIFEGHFPKFPILPGVCQVHLVKKILCDCTQKKLTLKEAKSIKFLAMIDPRKVSHISVLIQYKKNGTDYLTDAILRAGNITYFKLKAQFSASG